MLDSPVGDIFMLGGIIYEVIAGKPAFTNDDITVKRSPDMSLIVNSSPIWGATLAHLLQHMLSHEREERPDIVDVLSHPFFASKRKLRTLIFELDDNLLNKDHARARDGHPAIPPASTPTFDFLCECLKELESCFDWNILQEQLPELMKIPPQAEQPGIKRIEVWRTQVQYGDLSSPSFEMKDHPLPNLRAAVHYFRNFFAHVKDRATREAIMPEVNEIVNGEGPWTFLWAHPTPRTLFQGLWEAKFKARQSTKRRVRAANAAKESYDEAFRNLKEDLRKEEEDIMRSL